MPKEILILKSSWANEAAIIILNKLHEVLSEKGCCNVLLTGGNTAFEIYKRMNRNLLFLRLRNVNFFISDERFDVVSGEDLNSHKIMKTLFKFGIPEKCNFFPIFTIGSDIKKSLDKYMEIYPQRIDVMILSVASDGHIASLFPGNRDIHESPDGYAISESPEHKYIRVTITPREIAKCCNQFLLAIGLSKGMVIEKAIRVQDPVRYPFLLSNDVWLLDEDSASSSGVMKYE